MRTADDRASFRREQQKFQHAKRAEAAYARQLKAVANQIDHIIRGFMRLDGEPMQAEMDRALRDYSKILNSWSKNVAAVMLHDIRRRDQNMWKQFSNRLGKNLEFEMEHSSIGELMRQRLDDQIALITSMPIEAAQRVHDLTSKALQEGKRASVVAAEILQTGDVTKSRAMLIARTEVARTASELTMTRAKSVGITHYIWRTSGDSDVRHSHKLMNGKVIAFDEPPEVEPGKRYHAGQFPNCRCYPEPIIPDVND